MLTTAEIIREAYDILRAHSGRVWVQIADIQAMTGLTVGELNETMTELLAGDPFFRIEMKFIASMITEQDRRYAVKVAGADMHLIAWG